MMSEEVKGTNKKTKIQKGEYGYIKTKRKNLSIWLIIDVAFAVLLFIIGLLLNDFSNANVFTIFAMLFTIPGAKILVSLIVVAPYKNIDKDVYKTIEKNKVNKADVLYDLVLTSPEKVMYISSFAITKDSYIVLLNGNKKQDTEHVKNYINKHMSNYGFEKDIIIVKDNKEYVELIDKSEYVDTDIDNDIEKIKSTLLILQV